MKKFAALLLTLTMAFALTACGGGEGSDSNIKPPDSDAPAHEVLLYEAKELAAEAQTREDAGVSLQADYVYGRAQAAVSSLRFTIDNNLWLKGEGETVSDVVGGAPYGSWDEIVAAGMASPMPFYFEGLVYQVQGKIQEAEACYEKAKTFREFMSINPALMAKDFLVNGTKISYQELMHDKEMGLAVATLYDAKYRLRPYYDRVDELVKDAMTKKGSWTIQFNQPAEAESSFCYMPCTDIWTPDILLKSDGGSSKGNISGTYTGHFKVTMESQLADFDKNYANFWADLMNGTIVTDDPRLQALMQSAIPAGAPAVRVDSIYHWAAKSNKGTKSEQRYCIEQENLSVDLALPAGVSKSFFEVALDMNQMTQVENIAKVNRTIVVEAKGEGYVTTLTYGCKSAGRKWTEKQKAKTVVTYTGQVLSAEGSDGWTAPEDMRKYLSMTLVVDML